MSAGASGSAPSCFKPLQNPSTSSASPSASLRALWNYLLPALNHILQSPTNNTDKAPAIEVAYRMGIHTAVYNYFTPQSDSAIDQAPSAAPLQRGRKTNGTDLYDQLDRYYADVTREAFLGAPHDGSSLVYYLITCFNRYSVSAQSVSRLLNYVNRHYVKRAIDEDKGWLKIADGFDAITQAIQDKETHEQIRKRIKEQKTEELKKWGYRAGDSPEQLAQAEAYAEAASPPNRIVPLTSLALRRFRIEVIDPLLAIPKIKKGKKQKSHVDGDKHTLPKGRLARAFQQLLEDVNIALDEKTWLAAELATILKTVGLKVDHPLRKKLKKYVEMPTTRDSSFSIL